MLNYNTEIQSQPPITPDMQQQALAGLAANGPNNGRNLANALDLERWGAQQNNDFMARSQQAQMNSSVAGAQQMNELQQNLNNLNNTKQGMALQYSQNLLGGVNSILRGLYG